MNQGRAASTSYPTHSPSLSSTRTQHLHHRRRYLLATMKTVSLATFLFAAVSATVTGVAAICPGYNYGIGNQMKLGSGVSRCTSSGSFFSAFSPILLVTDVVWACTGDVYDDSCKVVDSLTTTGNPCTQGIFGCTPPPVTFNEYTNTFTHLKYACRPDPNSGKCGNDAISVCVSSSSLLVGRLMLTWHAVPQRRELRSKWPTPHFLRSSV